jgi:hypothetical protein
MNVGIAHDRGTRFKVPRLCTSFMPPAKTLQGTNGRCDPFGGMQNHTFVFVLPSLSEELGSVLLEAMHSGAAIVPSRTGGIPALIQHGRNGLLVSPGDASELAVAIDRLLSEPVFASRIRRMAHRNAGNRDWSTVAERVLAIYEAVPQRAPIEQVALTAPLPP